MRANERFSGGGHARHICKDCQKLGAEELTYRQAVRDIDRMIQWETGGVKRKQQNDFARFLRHSSERIRRYAESVAARSVQPDLTIEDGDLPWGGTEAPYDEDEEWVT